MRYSILAGVVAVLVGSCSSGSSAAVECVEPPEASPEVHSDFDLEIEPNPVVAGAEATLTVEYEGLGEPGVGLAASWECWDGSTWVETHLVVRADGDFQATTIELSTDSTIAIPAVGLRIPNSHRIIIPDVQPGLYRITDTAYDSQTQLTAHEFVEVSQP